MGPPDIGHRRADVRRVPGDAAAQGTLLRIATCFGGRVEIVIELHPDVRLRRARPAPGRYDGEGYDKLVVGHEGVELDDGELARARDPRRPQLRPHDARARRVRVRRALVGRPRPAAHRRRGARPARADRGLLARVDEHGHVPGPRVPPVHRAQRARAQGAQLRADRGDHGRGHDVAARDAGRRAQLGLPLHVDPRHRVHARARSHGLGFDWEAFEYFAFILDAVAAAPRGGRQVRAADHVRHRRRDATSPRARSTTSPATAARSRCGSATAPTTSSSTTSGGCSSTRSRSTSATAGRCPR